MKDGLYQFIVGVLDLFLWGGELVGQENLPRQGPAVFIANHLESTGPIGAACSIPLRLYSWVVADMVDPDLATDWLRWDFVERNLHLKPPASTWLAKRMSKVTVPFLRSLGCIPVYRGNYDRTYDTLRESMEVLRQGKFLMVFPEDLLQPPEPETRMKPFQRTFTRLGEMYFEQTGERLEFIPVTVHPSGYVTVSKAVAFNPLNPIGVERTRLKNLMEDTIRSVYLQMEHGAGSEVAGLTPQHK